MKIEKAIDYFYKQMELGKIESDYQQEIYETAISALEKQVPKKVNEIEQIPQCEDILDGYCPNCERYLTSTINYCPDCGQKLDWLEVENE